MVELGESEPVWNTRSTDPRSDRQAGIAAPGAFEDLPLPCAGLDLQAASDTGRSSRRQLCEECWQPRGGVASAGFDSGTVSRMRLWGVGFSPGCGQVKVAGARGCGSRPTGDAESRRRNHGRLREKRDPTVQSLQPPKRIRRKRAAKRSRQGGVSTPPPPRAALTTMPGRTKRPKRGCGCARQREAGAQGGARFRLFAAASATGGWEVWGGPDPAIRPAPAHWPAGPPLKQERGVWAARDAMPVMPAPAPPRLLSASDLATLPGEPTRSGSRGRHTIPPCRSRAAWSGRGPSETKLRAPSRPEPVSGWARRCR